MLVTSIPPFHGEIKCQHPAGCRFNAYYESPPNTFVCGQHSKKRPRTALHKDPDAKAKRQKKINDRYAEAKLMATANGAANKPGRVILGKLRMMQLPDYKPGYFAVFPNFKHQNRKDGFGCMELSPKAMGPVYHGQAGLPAALSIENYHQFNKVFTTEVNPETGEPLPLFFERQLAAYQDPTPHRHKFSPTETKQGKKNIPAFAVHKDNKGKLRKYTYVQSRYFYSHQYEIISRGLPDLVRLRQLLIDGWNLQLFGYDAFDFEADQRTVQQLYEDGRRPFGHELVLYSILTIAKPAEYPWNAYYRQHTELYE
jgi:hypothetical protein